MADLAVFGCSHSDNAANLPRCWSSRLEERLGWKVHNFARSGACNIEIFRHAMRYVADHQPKHMIVQWTELCRYPFNGEVEEQVRDHCIPQQEQENILARTWALQEVCAKKAVDCHFVSYYNLADVSDSSLWSQINKDKFLHMNFDQGWLNHCTWQFGFEDGIIQLPDNPTWLERKAAGHLTDEAVQYTADCWYEHLMNGERYYMENVDYNDHFGIEKITFRYVEEY